LPDKINFADFGGGDGFLALKIKEYLEKSGKEVSSVIIDGNPNYLKDAAKKGLVTLEAALENVELTNFDLIIMRSVLHYNSRGVQKKILQKLLHALKPKGIFIHQMSSGDQYNTHLRNALSQLPSLGRTHHKGAINFITIEDYLTICKKINLPTKLIGFAPGDCWTPEELFDRFNPDLKELKKRDRFLQEAKALIEHYKKTTPIKGILKRNDSFEVWRICPIFLSQKTN
jgi:SAM-dependent methyltransferase